MILEANNRFSGFSGPGWWQTMIGRKC